MRNGKFAARRSSGTKVVTLLLAVLVLVGCSVGATMAWLVKSTNEVVNTFTVGNIKIDLNEHVYDPATNTLKADLTKTNSNYKLIPGKNMPKDPFVTVKAGSEKCWLFVRIDEAHIALDASENAVKYSLDNEAWKTLTFDEDYDDGVCVYYRIVDASASDQNLYVLGKEGQCADTTHDNGCVTINADITSSFQSTPVLKFTAAAIQYDGLEVVDGTDPSVDYKAQAAQAAFEKLPADFTIETNLNTTVTPAPGGST